MQSQFKCLVAYPVTSVCVFIIVSIHSTNVRVLFQLYNYKR